MVTLHKMYFHFKELPLSVRVLYSGALVVLGTAYLFAMIHVFVSHAGRDGEPGLSVKDLVIAYSGSQEASRLEIAIQGPMQGMLDDEDRANIVAWVHSGATEEGYANVEPIFQNKCVMCHDEGNPHQPALTSYDKILPLTAKDQGADIFSLVRVSHIHLFGITFIFYIMGQIFSHAFMRPMCLKAVIVAVPFVFILLDIFSWYLTKLHPGFAWVIMGSGALMGLSFAIQWLVSMYQIWFFKLPEDAQRDGDLPKPVIH